MASLTDGGFPELNDELGRDPSAVLDVVAVLPRPGADSNGIDGAGLAARTAWPRLARRSADLAGVVDVTPERGTQLLVVLAAEVYFVFSPVQGEADGSVGLAAIDVVDEQGLDSLGHVNCSVMWRVGPSSISGIDCLKSAGLSGKVQCTCR